MFLWIRDQRWLPTIFVAAICLLVLGGLDILIQGPTTIFTSILIAVSVALSRALPYVSIGVFSVGTFVPLFLGLEPQLSQLGITLTLLILASFANTVQRWLGFGLNIVLGSIAYSVFVVQLPDSGNFYGLLLPTNEAKFALVLAGLVALIAVNANAWLIGRLLYTRITHVGTDSDRELLTQQIATTQLALAEQDRRFGIARDVNDLLLEQVSATLSSAEAGLYASKSDPTVAPRLLESLLEGLKKSYLEIRRLSDLLGLQKEKALALPGLRDLPSLFVRFREDGFTLNFREHGQALKLSSGVELVLYRIVFESLENIRSHTPLETEVDIDFIWQGNVLQITVKDNGEETLRASSKDATGYTVQDDQKALVERPVGAGLTTMQERVSLYAGTMDFVRVPGVGFNVSASFPEITNYLESN
jgi:signal transduction histidine kinase